MLIDVHCPCTNKLNKLHWTGDITSCGFLTLNPRWFIAALFVSTPPDVHVHVCCFCFWFTAVRRETASLHHSMQKEPLFLIIDWTVNLTWTLPVCYSITEWAHCSEHIQVIRTANRGQAGSAAQMLLYRQTDVLHQAADLYTLKLCVVSANHKPLSSTWRLFLLCRGLTDNRSLKSLKLCFSPKAQSLDTNRHFPSFVDSLLSA